MNLQKWLPAQDSPEIPVNENFEALSHMAVFAKDPTTTTGLTWGYLGGRWGGFPIMAGTLTLDASSTLYITAERSTGVISVSSSADAWNTTDAHARVYKLTTGVATVTSVEDYRAGLGGVHGIGSTGAGGAILVFDTMPEDPPMYTLFLVKSSADTTAPTVTAFTATSGVASPVPITAFTATDSVGVTGYWIGETSGAPALSDPGWSATPQASYTTATTGAVTLYARARDAAGNISEAATQAITISPGAAPAPVEIEWPYNPSVHTALFSVQGTSPTSSVALVYTPSDSRKLAKVQIPMRREIDGAYPGTGVITLEVRSGSATGALIGSATASFTDGVVSDRTFTFGSAITLLPATSYFLVLKLTGNTGGQALYRVLTLPGTGITWANSTTAWASYTAQSPLRLEFSA